MSLIGMYHWFFIITFNFQMLKEYGRGIKAWGVGLGAEGTWVNTALILLISLSAMVASYPRYTGFLLLGGGQRPPCPKMQPCPKWWHIKLGWENHNSLNLQKSLWISTTSFRNSGTRLFIFKIFFFKFFPNRVLSRFTLLPKKSGPNSGGSSCPPALNADGRPMYAYRWRLGERGRRAIWRTQFPSAGLIRAMIDYPWRGIVIIPAWIRRRLACHQALSLLMEWFARIPRI